MRVPLRRTQNQSVLFKPEPRRVRGTRKPLQACRVNRGNQVRGGEGKRGARAAGAAGRGANAQAVPLAVAAGVRLTAAVRSSGVVRRGAVKTVQQVTSDPAATEPGERQGAAGRTARW